MSQLRWEGVFICIPFKLFCVILHIVQRLQTCFPFFLTMPYLMHINVTAAGRPPNKKARTSSTDSEDRIGGSPEPENQAHGENEASFSHQPDLSHSLWTLDSRLMYFSTLGRTLTIQFKFTFPAHFGSTLPVCPPCLLCLLQRIPNNPTPTRAAVPPCVSFSGHTLTFFTSQILSQSFPGSPARRLAALQKGARTVPMLQDNTCELRQESIAMVPLPENEVHPCERKENGAAAPCL
jgi:hypothetical protein